MLGIPGEETRSEFKDSNSDQQRQGLQLSTSISLFTLPAPGQRLFGIEPRTARITPGSTGIEGGSGRKGYQRAADEFVP